MTLLGRKVVQPPSQSEELSDWGLQTLAWSPERRLRARSRVWVIFILTWHNLKFQTSQQHLKVESTPHEGRSYSGRIPQSENAIGVHAAKLLVTGAASLLLELRFFGFDCSTIVASRSCRVVFTCASTM